MSIPSSSRSHAISKILGAIVCLLLGAITACNTKKQQTNTAPAITSSNSATFTVGTAGTFTVTATGSPAPTFSETGALPSGVTLSSSGVLSGTPASGTQGSYPIVITASNGVSPNATQNFTLTVQQPAPTAPTITSATSTTFTVGTAGTFTVTATGFPAPTFSETGALPSGVTLSSSGVLSGTPASGTQGPYPIVITASNGVSPNATQNFTLTVGLAPAITSANNTTFTVGTAGAFTVTATGSPAPTFSETGPLPTGVTLSSAGVLSGTPGAGTGGTYPITITAQNGATPNATQNFTLTVNQAAAITSANMATFTVGSNGTFTVTTTGSPKPTLSIPNGSLPANLTFTDNGDGTATIKGIPAPATGGNYGFAITAHNGVGTDATQNFTLNVTACPTGGNLGLLNGDYALLLKGFDSAGKPALIGAVFVANGSGSITSGAEDESLAAGVQSLTISSGSYTIGTGTDGSAQRGCLALTTTQGPAQVTQNFFFSLSGGIPSSNGHIIEVDAAGPFTEGILRKQDPTAFSNAQISGNYAFGAGFIQADGSKLSCIGELAFSGGGAITGGAEDCNQSTQVGPPVLDFNTALTAFPASPVSINSGGTYSISGNGRGTLAFTPNITSPPTVNAFLYVVSSSELLVVSSGPQSSTPIFAGQIFKQSSSNFGAADFNGTSVVYAEGTGSTAGNSDATVGTLKTTGAAQTFTFNGYSNDGGSVSANSASGTFTVASNGRVSVSGGGGSAPVLWLVTQNKAFFLNSNRKVEAGFVEPQTGSSFTVSSISGTYASGAFDPQAPLQTDDDAVDIFTPNGVNSSFSEVTDDNSQGSLTLNFTITPPQTYSILDATNGVAVSPAGCTATGASANCNFLYIVISPTRVVKIDAFTGSANPAVSLLDQ
jgi:hypothetical protein